MKVYQTRHYINNINSKLIGTFSTKEKAKARAKELINELWDTSWRSSKWKYIKMPNNYFDGKCVGFWGTLLGGVGKTKIPMGGVWIKEIDVE